MSFVNSLMLIGIATAAIPIIIHLLNRRRHQTVRWGAMQFLLKATKESRGKKKLRHILILCCRALALATLFFALAQPLASSLMGWGSGQVDTVVLILDRSASMEMRPDNVSETKREQVLKRVAESMDQLNGARLILIDSATGQAEEVPSPDVLAELSSTAPTDTSADLPELLNQAVDYLATSEPGATEIWIASDLQASDWSPDSSRWELVRSGLSTLTPEPAVRVLAAREMPSINYGVELLSVRREADELALEARIFRNENAGPAPLQVTYNLGGAPSGEEITIDGQSVSFEKRLPLTEGQSGGWGYISIQSDQAPRDNVAFFSFGAENSTLTYIVTEDASSEMAINLGRVSALPGYRAQQARFITPEEAYKIEWSATSLVIWQAPLPGDSVAAQLEGFLSDGGAAIFFPPNEISGREFISHQWSDTSLVEKNQYFVPGAWDRQDGLLRDGIDGLKIPVDSLRAIRRQGLKGPSVALAAWDDQMPLLTRHVIDQGQAYFVTTQPDYRWSNFGDAVLLLPTVQRAIELGSQRLGSSFAAVVNRGEARGRPGEGRERLDEYFTEQKADPVLVAGIYRMGERQVASNRPREEDSSPRLSDETVAAIFDGTRYSLFEQDASDEGSLVTPFWRPFVVAMILFLVAEALLSLPKRLPTAKES